MVSFSHTFHSMFSFLCICANGESCEEIINKLINHSSLSPRASFPISWIIILAFTAKLLFFNKLHSPGVLVSRSLEVEPKSGGGKVRGDSFYPHLPPCIWGNAKCLEYAHTHTYTHILHGHHFNFQEMIWAVLFTQDFLQLKGECARSISFSFLLDLFISCQLCSYVYYGNLLFSSPPLFYASTPSLRTPLL